MWEEQLQTAIEAAKKAAKTIIDVYNTNFEVVIKSDKSPVTKADKESDKIIREYLHSKYPDYAFLTEEGSDDLSRLCKEFVWIVDPLDGTKDFVAHDGGFTINIALCKDHQIVVGVVYVPLTNEYYYASKGNGSYYFDGKKSSRIHVNDKEDELTCLTSVFHFNEAEKKLIAKHNDKIKHVESCGSSLKPCRIAQGKAEITYRLSPYTKEWDVAACDLILKEAGGYFVEPNGKNLVYNREDVYNRNGYVCANIKKNILL